jgi:hypothetical protein
MLQFIVLIVVLLVRLPEGDLIRGDRDKPMSPIGEASVSDRSIMSPLAEDFPLSSQVPEDNLTIGSTADECALIGGDRDTHHRTDMSQESGHFSTAFQRPQANDSAFACSD